MIPIDRFNLDHNRIRFLNDDEYSEEIFYVEEIRKVTKTNTFSINSQKFECPVDLRLKKIQVRYDRSRKHRFIVYYANKRMGQAAPVNLIYNSKRGAQHD